MQHWNMFKQIFKLFQYRDSVDHEIRPRLIRSKKRAVQLDGNLQTDFAWRFRFFPQIIMFSFQTWNLKYYFYYMIPCYNVGTAFYISVDMLGIQSW